MGDQLTPRNSQWSRTVRGEATHVDQHMQQLHICRSISLARACYQFQCGVCRCHVHRSVQKASPRALLTLPAPARPVPMVRYVCCT